MSWYDNILKFLGLRKRSAPNSKTLWLYLFAVISPEMFAYYARDYILVLLCIGTLFDRKISFFFIPYLSVNLRLFDNSYFSFLNIDFNITISDLYSSFCIK